MSTRKSNMTPEERSASVSLLDHELRRLVRHYENSHHPAAVQILMTLVPAQIGVDLIRRHIRDETQRDDHQDSTDDSVPVLVIDEDPYIRGVSTESLSGSCKRRQGSQRSAQAEDADHSAPPSPQRRRPRIKSPPETTLPSSEQCDIHYEPKSPRPDAMTKDEISPVPTRRTSRIAAKSDTVVATTTSNANIDLEPTKSMVPTAPKQGSSKIPIVSASSTPKPTPRDTGKPVVTSDVQILPPLPTRKGKLTGTGRSSKAKSSKGKQVTTVKPLPKVSLPQQGKKSGPPEDPAEKAARLEGNVTTIDEHDIQHKVVYKHQDLHHYVSRDHPKAVKTIDKRHVTKETHAKYLRKQQAALEAQSDSAETTQSQDTESDFRDISPTAPNLAEASAEAMDSEVSTPAIGTVKTEVLDAEEDALITLTPSSRRRRVQEKRAALRLRVTDNPTALVVLESDDEYEQAADGTTIKREREEILQHGMRLTASTMSAENTRKLIESLSQDLAQRSTDESA